jgi:hypothetical protein
MATYSFCQYTHIWCRNYIFSGKIAVVNISRIILETEKCYAELL